MGIEFVAQQADLTVQLLVLLPNQKCFGEMV